MENYLWKFYWDCRRQGGVEGLFVATEDKVKDLIGKQADFGEILGKHSEVYGTIEEGEITKVNLDSETVDKVTIILGETWSGYNPIHYVQYECPKCEDSYMEEEFNLEKNMCTYCVEEEGK